MLESYGEIIFLSHFMLVYMAFVNSDCPMRCECDIDNEAMNLNCTSTIPDMLPLNTRVVSITDIAYEYLQQSDFNNARWENVTKLYLRGGSVNSVFSDTFWNVSNLTHLQISFPNLKRLSVNAFSQLTKLHTLDLSGNFLLSFDVVADALRVNEFTNNLDELNLHSLAMFLTPCKLKETFFLQLQRFSIKR
ncbi:hypothetical protein ACJMK2_020854 [Sinanodonta woodiana]|uniref:Uncharacterized protein n=1 Tax=Sinanodonta woodiana TaxID=1069815 RepID=A0ABD3U0B8_SINWO